MELRFVSFPMDEGIGPVSLFELISLHDIIKRKTLMLRDENYIMASGIRPERRF